MTRVADNSEVLLTKKRSLLTKYDLPLYYLDFDYVKKCKDVKELEKIIKVLRSKEEGYYPDLEACAEAQLAALDGKNRLLRRQTKVMTKADLSKEEWNSITTDLLDWKGGVEENDLKMLDAKSPLNGQLPRVRSSPKGFQPAKTMNKADKSPRISSLDYKSWEKFDAEEECKKMDLDEDMKLQMEKVKIAEEKKSKKTASIEDLAIESLGDISHLSQQEREVMALREKDIGNEFYNTNKNEESIKHYTRSILLHPTVAGLNNRAAAYLRQCAFNKALIDLNQVLKMDPKNVKARFRRAQSFQHKNLFREALDDINEVLMKQPTHVVARHIADQLRDSIATLPRVHRIKIKDKTTGKTAIKTVTEAEMLNDYKNEKFVEVNDWGLPKIMCNCNGKHSNDPGIRHEDHVRFQHLKMVPTKKVEPTKQEPPKVENKPIPLPGKKLEILEVEKGSQDAENGELLKSTKDVDSPDKSLNPCVVADMRTSKSTQSVCKDGKSLKTDKNAIIKDTSLFDKAVPSPPSQLAVPPAGVDHVKDVKTDQNMTIQENGMVNGHTDSESDEVAPESKLPCGCRENFAKFQFKKEWCALAGPKALEQKAKLLKSICPKHLVQAFGNYWDNKMLADVLKCLRHHFGNEQPKIAEYLEVIPQLDRFKINSMFLTDEEKSLARELVRSCSVNVDSNIISAYPS